MMKGNIIKPAIKDKIFAGAYERLYVVYADSFLKEIGSRNFSESCDDYMGKHGGEWNTNGMFSLGEDPRAKYAEGSSTRYAKVLPDVPGLQKIQFDDAFGGKPELKGHLYAFDGPDGKEREVWTTEKAEDDMYSPLILVLDADADGLPDVVVATHYRIMVFDGKTGAKKMELRWHHGRNYGYFGSFMVPGDPYPKFLVIADFISHIDVVNNNGKELTLQWRKEVEATIIRKQKITRPGPNPLADLDGDGKVEITLNLFNDKGDRKWHTISYDAMTGDTRFDLPDTYLHGLADVNKDGLPELFVGETHGLAVSKFSAIRLLSLKGGKRNTLWSHERARWQTTSLTHLPITSSTGAADGYRTVLIGQRAGHAELYAIGETPSPTGDRQSLVVAAPNASGKYGIVSKITVQAGSHLEVKGVRARGQDNDLLLGIRSASSDEPKIYWKQSARPRCVSSRIITLPTPVPICARLRPGEKPTVIFQNCNEQVVAVQKIGGTWKTRWSMPGRGMTNAVPSMSGVLSADINGDGEMETLIARTAKSGEAELVAVAPDGKQVWSHVFTGHDGAAPIWNFGGLTYWTVGRFTSKSHLDVFATLRCSTMHSDEGYCLSGIDGHLIWRQDCVTIPGMTDHENTRGYAGVQVAVADVNGDRLDELICEFPDRYWVASGKTGEIQTVVNTANGIFPNMWVAYAIPAVADFLGQGKLQVLWGNSYITALLSVDGKPLWYGQYRDGPAVTPGVGGAEGPGRLFIGGDGYTDGFRCYDPISGAVKWTYNALAGTNSPYASEAGPTITADVDGDGIQEFLFTHKNWLYALNGKGGSANLVWSMELPVTPKSLGFADTDGDAKPELLFGGNDGYVYTVGQ